MWRDLRYRLGGFIRLRMRRSLSRTLAAASSCAVVQEATLRRILRLNATSRFSRLHELHRVNNPTELRRALPICGYDVFESAIVEMRQGDQAALLGEHNRLLMFALTSGTTASTKFIPVTRSFLGDYRRGWQNWGIRAFDAHSSLHRSQIVMLCSAHDKQHTPSGIPCGSISGLAQSMQSVAVRAMYSIPHDVVRVDDPLEKLRLSALFAVADPHVGMVTTANPSTLVQFAQFMEGEPDALLKHLCDGTLPETGGLPQRVRLRMASRLRRRRMRGRQLRDLVNRHGKLTPRLVWPGLSLLAVWTGGSVAGYLPLLRQLYGDVPLRDHGLSASEGRMTIPLEDETDSGLLDIESHFFEFVPEEEWGSESPTVLLAHELEVGRSYFILLTTSSGLTRYDIHDVVQCTGFLGTTPMLRFLHKGAHVSSLTGEKLTESQVVAAVSSVLAGDACAPAFSVTPCWGDPPGYLLLLESALAGRVGLVEDVEQALQCQNMEYAEKRRSGRLAPLGVQVIPDGTFARLACDRQQGPGGTAEQYKHPFLFSRLGFWDEFQARYLSVEN